MHHQPTEGPTDTLDRLITSYMDWRDACDELADAHVAWSITRSGERRHAADAYAAALVWEEQAAERYRSASASFMTTPLAAAA